ncbi:ABC transporter ATP-binding protein [Candidatus Collierbacteria bacterium]|nr:ABC transporter ATP-binding protein [Candidatus Collierbacteria bacterium]
MENVIEVKNVSKKFCKNIKRLMMYGLMDVVRGIINLPTHAERLRRDEFWALRNVSFDVKKGESVGFIGLNGSGKSSLLKLINGIFLPDVGEIMVQGKTGALIEAGVGFHPSLTGRENIYLNGTILGMKKKEIDERFSDIVSFAEIKEFLDTPVKNYSSGMVVRLGFSIAVHSAPDILLIDEILAVGDLAFQKKCFEKIKSLRRENNVTIVFVSHDMDNILRICDRCILLDRGKVKMIGEADRVVSAYLT